MAQEEMPRHQRGVGHTMVAWDMVGGKAGSISHLVSGGNEVIEVRAGQQKPRSERWVSNVVEAHLRGPAHSQSLIATVFGQGIC